MSSRALGFAYIIMRLYNTSVMLIYHQRCCNMQTGCSPATCFQFSLDLIDMLSFKIGFKSYASWWIKGKKYSNEEEEELLWSVKKLLPVSITSSYALLKCCCFQMCQPFFTGLLKRKKERNRADILRQHHSAHPPPPPPPKHYLGSPSHLLL